MHHHQIQLPNTSWPVLHSAPGNPSHATNVPFSVRAGNSNPPSNQSSISLNDPSIIFAQPAARPVGIPGNSHEGHWHSPVTLSSLVNNGTVGNSGNSPSFLVSWLVQILLLSLLDISEAAHSNWGALLGAHEKMLESIDCLSNVWNINYMKSGSEMWAEVEGFVGLGTLRERDLNFPQRNILRPE